MLVRVEHFKEVVNQPSLTTAFDHGLLIPAIDLPVNLAMITVAETKKNGKAAGLDEILPKLLKSGDQCPADTLTDLLNACWAASAVPEEWKRGMNVMLSKKAISLSVTTGGVPGKVFSIVLLNRLRQALDPCIREQQAGFRSGRSCIEQISDK